MPVITPSLEQNAASRARGLAASAQVRKQRPSPSPRTPTAAQKAPRRNAGPPLPRSRRILPPPELGAVVTLNCSPPEQGTVERVDLNRKLAYVRTEYGVLPYGFAEIKR